MIGIKIGDVDLDMPAGAGVSIEWVSTLFNDSSELLGSYSYPFTLPFTQKNDEALGFARLPENRLARKDIEVILSVMGLPWKRSTMQFEVSATGYSANLLIDNAEFADFIKNRDLPDLFTVYVDGLFKDLTWVKISSTDVETRAFVGDSIRNPGKYPWVFFPLRNEMLSGTIDTSGGNNQPKHYVNRFWFSQASMWYATTDENDKLRRWHCPFFYLTWVLKQLFARLGFKPMGEFFTDPEMASLVIYNTGMLDYETFYNSTGLKLAPARHLPKIKLNDFLKALRNPPLNLSFYFAGDTREAWVGFKESILNRSSYEDLSPWVNNAIPEMKRNDNGAFLLKAKFDQADEVTKIMPTATSYRIGPDDREAKTIEMSVGSLNMLRIASPDEPAKMWRTPWARQTANLYSERAKDWASYNDPAKLYNFSANDFAFRLVAYKGMVKDQPYATSDSLDPEELDVYANAAQPGGDKGWLARKCKEWYLFLSLSEQHQLEACFPVDVLQKLNPLQKIGFRTKSGVLLPALFDRLSFEHSAQLGARLKTKFSVYPHFNLTALLEKKIFEVSAESAVQIYARLTIENIHLASADQYGYTNNGDVVIRFFMDPTALVPYVVKDAVVVFEEVRTWSNSSGAGSEQADIEQTGANGSVYTARRNVEVYKESHYQYQDTVTWTWTLKTSKRTNYTLI